MLCGSSASEVSLTASPKDSKAVAALRSRSKKTKNRRKKGDDAGNSVRPLALCFINSPYSKISPFGFASSLLRGAGALF
jgi:hypothetical protein